LVKQLSYSGFNDFKSKAKYPTFFETINELIPILLQIFMNKTAKTTKAALK